MGSGTLQMNLPQAQCSSGGRFQSRPFPARTAKVMESEGQLTQRRAAMPDGEPEREGDWQAANESHRATLHTARTESRVTYQTDSLQNGQAEGCYEVNQTRLEDGGRREFGASPNASSLTLSRREGMRRDSVHGCQRRANGRARLS